MLHDCRVLRVKTVHRVYEQFQVDHTAWYMHINELVTIIMVENNTLQKVRKTSYTHTPAVKPII